MNSSSTTSDDSQSASGKRRSRGFSGAALATAVALHFGLLALTGSSALAAPEGGNIVGGSGSISQSGLTTAVQQNSSALAINWNSFNLNANEIVNYVQPGAASIALNRIVGGSASQIHGQINANGRIVLVNPNGVFFGQNARVNVGGLIASGLDIKPADFMNGDYVFKSIDGTSGAVVNAGILTASLGGSISLLGQRVENSGLISANLGAVNLAAGKAAVLTFDHAGLIGVQVTEAMLQDELGLDPAVLNRGEIKAEAGQVLLTGSQSRDVFSAAVNRGAIEQASSVVVHADGSFTLGAGADVVNDGVIDVSSESAESNAGQVAVLGENIIHRGNIHADASSADGGRIELHAVDTTSLTGDSSVSARAANGRGGNIKILGDKVGLFDSSRVDASGGAGGGSVLIGGDRSGFNARVRNAQFVYLGENTRVGADALDFGDGGKIITFAEDSARIYGALSARGGVHGGDGGFIETSGLKYFRILKTPDITAPAGSAGEWLIDPNDITIVDTCSLPDCFITASNPFVTSDDGAQLEAGLIVDALTGNATVTITTGIAGNNLQLGDIVFATDLDYDLADGTNTLILNAANNIETRGFRIYDSDTGSVDILNLEFHADRDSLGASDGVGNVIIDGTRIQTYSGSFTATGVDFDLRASGSSNDAIDTGAGGIDLTMSGNIIFTNTEIETDGGAFLAAAVGNITVSDSEIDTDGGTLTASGVNFVLSKPGGSGSDTIETNGGDVTLTMTGMVDLDAEIITNGGNFTLATVPTGSSSFDNTDANGIIDTSVTGSGSAGNIEINTNGDADLGTLISRGDATAVGGTVTVTAGNDITLTRDYNFFDTHDTNNTLTFNAANDININAQIFDSTTGERDTLDIVFNADSDNSLVGNVNINDDIFTGGGNFSASGANFNNSSQVLNTNFSQNSGDSMSSTGGHILLDMTGTVMLGDLGTEVLSPDFGDLTILAGGDVTDAFGSLFINDQTLIAAVGNVFLTSAINDFVDDVRIVSAVNVALVDVNEIALGSSGGTSTINGTLDVTARGDVTDNGALVVTGVTTIDSGGNNIVLDDAANDFLIVTAGVVNNLSLTDLNDVILGAATVAGTLDVNAQGSGRILQIGTLNVSGTTTLNATDDAITLLDAGNDFATLVLDGGNVSIQDVNAVLLGTTTASGNLAVTTNANGTITQSGIVTVGGVATLNAAGADITLDDPANNFTNLAVLAADNVDITDVDGIVLNASTIAGMLDVDAAGAISQVGALSVTGDANFDASGNDITLGNAGNNFSSLSADGANVVIQDSNSIDLLASSISATLNVTANGAGDITQSGVLAVTGLATLTAAGDDITLADPGNNFASVAVVAANVDLEDVNAIDLAASVVGGTLDVDTNAGGGITQSGLLLVSGNASFVAAGNSVTLADPGNLFSSVAVMAMNADIQDANSILLNSSTLTGTLDVTANSIGSITQAGPLQVAGLATFTATANAITLQDAGNDFSTVAVNGVNANLSDTNALDLGLSNVSGALGIAAAGAITQSGALIVASGATTLDAGGNDITLDDNSNNFLSVTASNVNNLRLTDLNDISLGASIVGGTLDVTALGSGAISQSGALDVTGTANFTAVADNITLSNAGNDFSTMTANGGNVAITDANDLDLGTSTASGTFAARSNGGDITQSGPLNITGSASFRVNNARSIRLGDSANSFPGGVSFLANSGSLLDVFVANSGPLDLGAIAVTQHLSVVTTGAISNSGPLIVGGVADFNAGVNPLTLDNSSNNFNDIVIVNAGAAIIRDVNDINIGTADVTSSAFNTNTSVSGTLDLATASGAITDNDTSAVSVGGVAILSAGSGPVVLDSATNSLAGANITSPQDVALINATGINLQGGTIGGNLDVIAGGSIGNTGGVLDVAGTARFLVPQNNSVSIASAGNRFGGVLTFNAFSGSLANIAVRNALATDIEALSANNLAITSAGPITQSGAFSVTNATTLSAVSAASVAQNITLVDASNEFSSLTVSNGNQVTISEAGANNLTIAGINASGTLTLDAANVIQNGAIVSQNGEIILNATGAYAMAAPASINAQTGNINLTATGNIDAAAFSAAGGVVNITSTGGAISDSNGDGVNFTTPVLNVLAANGIGGANDALESRASSLNAINSSSGEVNFQQSGDVNLVALQNNGSVGTVNFESDRDIRFNPGSVVARLGAGDLFMRTERGSFLGLGLADVANPDITAQNAIFFGRLGQFGTLQRPLTLNVPGNVFIDTQGFVDPIFVPPGPATLITTGIDFSILAIISSTLGDQLLDIESLGAIDPAIFTELKNFSAEEVSILLPRDQLYEDDLEEEQ